MDYTYRGDRWTDPALKGMACSAVRWEPPARIRSRGGRMCVRGPNGNMLVQRADGTRVVVLGRQLRKVQR
jgi:hypothetical protein